MKEVVCQGESSDEIKQTLLGCRMWGYPGLNGEQYPKFHIEPIDEKLENIPDVHEYAKIIQEECERNMKKREERERKRAEKNR